MLILTRRLELAGGVLVAEGKVGLGLLLSLLLAHGLELAGRRLVAVGEVGLGLLIARLLVPGLLVVGLLGTKFRALVRMKLSWMLMPSWVTCVQVGRPPLM